MATVHQQKQIHAEIQKVWDALHGNWEAQQALVALRDYLIDIGVIDK